MGTVYVTKTVVMTSKIPLQGLLSGTELAVIGGVGVALGLGAAFLMSSSSSNSNNNARTNDSSEKGGTNSIGAKVDNVNNGCPLHATPTGNANTTASGSGNGGDKDEGKDDKENQHEKDETSDDEESDNENQSKKDKNKPSKRKVTTAWLKPVFYPEAPVRVTDPSHENFIIRIKVPLMRLQSVGENGFYPRQHLLYRVRMLFYGFGRLRQLCSELGLMVNDICKFGTSVYKDSRARMVKKSIYIHAAHVFPITDFDFDMIRASLRQLHRNETQERINEQIHELERILRNMVGQTDYVHRDFNMSGGVGRALDIFLKNFIQKKYEDINSGNVGQILHSLSECLSSSITKTTQREIEATIQSMLSADHREWINYYRMGFNRQYDYHFNVSLRFIDAEYRERCERSKSRDRDDGEKKKMDEKKKEDKDKKKQK